MKKSYAALQANVSDDNLIATLRKDFDTIKDSRASNCSFTLSDLLMSVFAMFTLKYESLLEFDKQSKAALLNLKQIFGVNILASDRSGFYGLSKGWLIIFVIFLAPAYNGTNPVDDFVANRI